MKTSRRRFVAAIGVGAAWAACGAPAILGKSGPRVAITMDDFGWGDTPALDAKSLNDALLGHYAAKRLKAGVFVTGNRVDSEEGRRYVATWDRAGHLIANHSYSHLEFPSRKVGLAQFADDLVRNETVVGGLPGFKKYFRFPYLKEGDTVEKRDGMRRFLHSRGYRNGHVTIDASDWYVDGRLRKRLEREPKADLAPYRRFYLDHIWERASFYDDLARKVTGRSIPHTLLTHYNMLNGLFLGDLVEMFRSKGWAVVDVEEAFADPIFTSEPAILPAGESLVWALAKATGKYEKALRYPGEDGDYEAPKMDALGL
jgi:peptidoglycan/xylan/chitin deacetylase (PgdA/CDA1 family)